MLPDCLLSMFIDFGIWAPIVNWLVAALVFLSANPDLFLVEPSTEMANPYSLTETWLKRLAFGKPYEAFDRLLLRGASMSDLLKPTPV